MEDKKIKIERLQECGNYLRFVTNADKTQFKLSSGGFCKNRFCPICSWLKAKKTAYMILEMLTYANRIRRKEFIFITLTAPNVPASDLKSEITDFNESWKRMMKLKEILKINLGYIRKLEVTYNEEENTYHPHFHIIMAVNHSYFTSRDYISRVKLLEIWKKSKRDDSITQVDVKKIKMDSIKEVMEIATYSTKMKDLLKNQNVFNVFYENMRGRQLLTFNGIFKEIKKLFDTGELEEELTQIEELEKMKVVATTELLYKWKDVLYEQFGERELSDFEKFYKIDMEIE